MTQEKYRMQIQPIMVSLLAFRSWYPFVDCLYRTLKINNNNIEPYTSTKSRNSQVTFIFPCVLYL